MTADEGRLDIVQAAVARQMDEILSLFKPGALVTVIVRNPAGEHVQGAQDFLMTNDELDQVAALVDRRRKNP